MTRTIPRVISLVRSLILCALPSLLPACATPPTPINPATLDEPALQRIVSVYADAVQRANTDPNITWHAGWFGNGLVHFLGDSHKGLCYDWQRMVYASVADRVTQEGWQMRAITIELTKPGEHHAVLVYDPTRVPLLRPLIHAEQAPSFVLDPWRTGQPKVYRFHDWIRNHLDEDPPFLIETLPQTIHPQPQDTPTEHPEPYSRSRPATPYSVLSIVGPVSPGSTGRIDGGFWHRYRFTTPGRRFPSSSCDALRSAHSTLPGKSKKLTGARLFSSGIAGLYTYV